MTTTLRKPDAAPPKRSRTEWDEIVRSRQELDEERKRLNRQADAIAKQVAEIDLNIMALVDAECGTDRSITLKHFRLSIVQVKRTVSWLSEFTKRLGRDLVEELKASAGTRDQLVIESRERPPATAKAA
jgi:hypothetical protein